MRIHNKEGIVLRDPEHVLGRWKEYVEELYDKESKPSEKEIPLEEYVEEDMQGPITLFSEFETALAELKAKKAEGPDGTHTHNRFTALWNLSGKTRVSRYQKNIHPLLSL